MADLTENDIRAACVAAGIPGAEVEEMRPMRRFGMCDLGRWKVRVPGRSIVFYADGTTWAMGLATHAAALAVMREHVERERDQHAAALAEVDRVLGRDAPCPACHGQGGPPHSTLICPDCCGTIKAP